MKVRDWWKPEYDELSEYNSEKSRASGNQYKIGASPSERMATRNAAQNWLNSLSAEYVTRMEAIQADYNAMAEKQFQPGLQKRIARAQAANRRGSLFGKVREWWFGK